VAIFLKALMVTKCRCTAAAAGLDASVARTATVDVRREIVLRVGIAARRHITSTPIRAFC